MQKSMNLTYEPFSELLHISVKELFIHSLSLDPLVRIQLANPRPWTRKLQESIPQCFAFGGCSPLLLKLTEVPLLL